MDENTIKLLDFEKILNAVADFSVSERTKNFISAQYPIFDKTIVERNLEMTSEAAILQNKYLVNPIVQFDDITDIAVKAAVGETLSPGELLKIAKLIRSVRIAKKTVDAAGEDIEELKKIFYGIFINVQLENEIFESIVNENEISDKASEKLYSLRKKIYAVNFQLKDKLASYSRSNEVSKYLQDNIVTIRGDRYVIPVKAEYKSQVKGLIHDQSASGSTVFIEPFAVVELNNELKTLKSEENAEIDRILRDFTQKVANNKENLLKCQESSTMLDIVFSKMKYSEKLKGTRPIIVTEKKIVIKNARHPLIESKKVVPVDINIGTSYNILVITGPNTGGKTVYLKTVGLMCAMTYIGVFPPCEKAEICVFSSIFCDIGDEQSIVNELSTFSSHMTNIIKILNNVDANSLTLFDELGGGTDPHEGAALAVAIVKYLEERGCLSIVTSHYSELKEYALTSGKTENAGMQFNKDTLMPTYRVIIGTPGSSNALSISRKLGLLPEIIEYALKQMSPEQIKFDQLLRNAEDMQRRATEELEKIRYVKKEIEEEKIRLNSENEKLSALEDKLKSNAAAETKRLIVQKTARADEILEEMKEKLKASDEAAILTAKKLRNELEDIGYNLESRDDLAIYNDIDKSKLKVGMQVTVKSLHCQGIIRQLNTNKNNALISVGNMETVISLDNLAEPINSTNKKVVKHIKKDNKTADNSEKVNQNILQEVNVIGLTVSEAIDKLEPYLLNLSKINGQKVLRIIHGKGTGKLGKGIQGYLKTLNFIESYRYGGYGEGDSGATVVTFK